VISVLACVAGVAVGWAAARVLARLLQLPFFFDLNNGVVLCALAVALNLLFATLPALRAARLDPIHALRSA
jgi:ABC-type antimicrobial peptide transport system permease subunit